MRELVCSPGVPARFPEVGIGTKRTARVRQWDGASPIATNPRPVRSAAVLEEIPRLALW